MHATRPIGLREKQKEERRGRILSAMMDLLSAKPLDDITNNEIAERAGLTVPTLYNLIGSRTDILVLLLSTTMDDLKVHNEAVKNVTPLARAERIGSFLVKRFTSQEDAYRQVVRGVNAISLKTHKPYRSSPHRLYLELMQEAERDGAFRPSVRADQVADRLFQIFAGALITWAIDGLNRRQFAAQVTEGFHTVIAAFATDNNRELALGRLNR